MSKKSFILMRDLLSTVDLMTDEEAGKLLKAIINHVDGEVIDLPREVMFAFAPIKNQLNRDLEKYDAFVEKQRVNGKKGGRPQNPNNPSLLQETQVKPNNLVTVTDNDNVTDIDNKKPKTKKASSSKIEKPEGVEEEVWQDWNILRKTKKAPVTNTVLKGAIKQAGIAQVSLNEFFQIWCRRGSQGLEASWIKPDERLKPSDKHGGFDKKDYQSGATDVSQIGWMNDEPS